MNPAKLLAASLALGLSSSASAQTQPHSAAASHIPPDADRAAEALKASPRHGEWADIALTGSDSKLHTWIVYPERADKAPVVLVIHEIFGLTDWVRGVADQLAADGFIAVAPDLLSGRGPDGGGTESFPADKVREAIQALGKEETAKRLSAARDHALALPAASSTSATIGFCWGGSASFNYAAAQPALNAAVVYYGTAPMDSDNKPDTTALAKIKCPVLGLYGGDDARVTSTVEATTTAMKVAGKTFSAHTYDGAGHGFLRQQKERNGANLKAAEEAWHETIAFLRKHLK